MISNTNFNLYKSFLVVYETKNMNHASKILGTSREAIRQNIRELGNQLNRSLFVSHKKGVEPTIEASKLYPVIKDAVNAIIKAEKDLQPINETGTIKIALSNMAVYRYINDYLGKFQIEFFKRGNAEVDFVIDSESVLCNYSNKIPLFTLNSVFACTNDFMKKYGLSQTLSKDELLGSPIVARSETWNEISKQFDTKIKPSITKTTSSDMTYSLVKSSVGIGLLPKRSTQDLIELDVKDIFLPTANIICAYNKNLSSHTKAFIDGLIKFCKS